MQHIPASNSVEINMFKLETAIQTWRHQFKYSRSFKGRDLDELEQHVRDQVAHLVSNGMSDEEAFRSTIRELGSIEETESDYRDVAWMKTRDAKNVLKELGYSATLIAGYFRVAFRNLKKNKVSSTINLFGLALSISVCLVTYVYVVTSLTFDHYHENADRIFHVQQVTIEEDGPQRWGRTPALLGPAIDESSARVDRVVRMDEVITGVAYGDGELRTGIRFVDPEFLDMFTFPLASGTDEALRNPDQVIISERARERFFGQSDAVGETLSIRSPDGNFIDVTVSGVAVQFPANSGIRFSLLMSYEAISRIRPAVQEGWGAETAATFVQVFDANDASLVQNELATYTDQINAVSSDWQIIGFELDNLKSLSKNADQVNAAMVQGLSMAPIVVLSSVSLLLLLLSCFNYMNVTIATSTRRLKEIGVRKVVGGSRKQLAFQFLTENIELSAAAIVIGLGMAAYFTLPAFNQIANSNMELGLLSDIGIWIFLVVVVIGTGTLSGAYPAIYISGFRPTAIFQGRERLARRRPITQTFLTFQFMLAFLTMLSGIVFLLNGRFHANQDWGYDGEHVLIFQAQDQGELNFLKSVAESAPAVLAVTTSRDAIGFSQSGGEVLVGDDKFEMVAFRGSRDYLDFMGVNLKDGQMLGDSLSLAGTESIVVNETFVTEAGITDPVGSFVSVDSVSYAIAGVIQDFHYQDFFSEIRPVVFRIAPEDDHRFLSMKVQPGSGVRTADLINTEFKTAFSGVEARYYFQDEKFQSFYNESMGIASIFSFIATLALIISCLSIYALSAQNVINRLREVGVRKVLGATPLGIAQLVNRKYLVMLTVATALCIPLGYVSLDWLLGNIYAYRMDLTPIPFVITYALFLLTAVMTISIQVFSINRTCPADVLRND